jgi:hypothetical protein
MLRAYSSDADVAHGAFRHRNPVVKLRRNVGVTQALVPQVQNQVDVRVGQFCPVVVFPDPVTGGVYSHDFLGHKRSPLSCKKLRIGNFLRFPSLAKFCNLQKIATSPPKVLGTHVTLAPIFSYCFPQKLHCYI